MTPDQNKAREMIKAVHEDQEATINGRVYKFTKMTHEKRLTVFAFMTSHQAELSAGNFSCFVSSDYPAVKRIIETAVLFDGSSINKCEGHWEKYPSDFLMLFQTAIGVITYPFTPASNTN